MVRDSNLIKSSGSDMDWCKIKTKHFVNSGLTMMQKGRLATFVGLITHLECFPNNRQLTETFGKNYRQFLESFGIVYGNSATFIAEKVLQDVAKALREREESKHRQANYRGKHKEIVTRYVTGNVTPESRVEENRREDITKGDTKKGFQKPTMEEVKKHFTDVLNLSYESDRFWYFYESKNWMVGKNKMAKWKSAAANWAKTARERANQQKGRVVIEIPTRSQPNKPEPLKTATQGVLPQQCAPPSKEFQEMISKLASRKEMR